ncbi:hypothetical protein LJB93_00095 [Desulfovibrio sp. OttesenSCG-928-F07]|nr:hypothetical protein [Desulfovibrio sp. OttesenSCG-928-F07]
MPRTILTETKIKQLKPKNKPYKVSDGTIGGLHLAVSVAGGMNGGLLKSPPYYCLLVYLCKK